MLLILEVIYILQNYHELFKNMLYFDQENSGAWWKGHEFLNRVLYLSFNIFEKFFQHIELPITPQS